MYLLFKIYFLLVISISMLNSQTLNQGGDYDVSNVTEATNWEFETGKKIFASPVIDDNVLYIGSFDKNFYAIAIETGTEIWRFETSHPILSTALVNGDEIYFESGNILYALNKNGEELWRYQLCSGLVRSQFDSWDYYHSSPVFYEGLIYIGTQNGTICGLNAGNGNLEYFVETGKGNGIRTTPLIYNGKIYFGDWKGAFYTYDLITTELVWEYDTWPERLWGGGASITTSPVIYDDILYFAGRCCILYAFNPETGEKYWSFGSPTNEWMVGGPTISDGIIYLGSSNQRIVQAFNAKTGEMIWQKKMNQHSFASPLMVDDYAVFAIGELTAINRGALYFLDKTNGEIKFGFNAQSNIYSSPVLHNDKIYFGASNGKVYSLSWRSLITNVENDEKDSFGSFKLNQNYPNPFNPNTVIEFSIPSDTKSEMSKTELIVFDMLGREVSTIINEHKGSGNYSVTFNAEELPTGIYFYQLRTGENTASKKMMLLK